MNYRKESLRNALAAEYVLGTLRGGARRRYQQLMMQSQLITETTWLWEQYLNGLGQQIPPVEPPVRVWQAIEQKLGLSAEQQDNVVPIGTSPTPRPVLWQAIAGLATAAAIVIAVVMMPGTAPEVTPVTDIAVVADDEARPLWLIEISQSSLAVRSTANLTARTDKDFELWMVPADGSAPISLGLLPEGGQLALNRPGWFNLSDIAALAVSLEPNGGSPDGSPTEILYIAPISAV
ncbi:anti-sigma factor [Alteromonas gilva]|uniref:Anti-sigma factor n=1 Tax=Alteromonas gilva TaxID=2987522 RepID=A0ABT5L5L1_9ALTE|nr:anti-sigma factor [Alteromonas gilva]MDC8832340.1 anti-sigma factor [Alteromonas gilva]